MKLKSKIFISAIFSLSIFSTALHSNTIGSSALKGETNQDFSKVITLDKNGGVGGTDSITVYEKYFTGTSNSGYFYTPDVVVPPTKEGYDFMGYYVKGQNNQLISGFGTTYYCNTNQTRYANFLTKASGFHPSFELEAHWADNSDKTDYFYIQSYSTNDPIAIKRHGDLPDKTFYWSYDKIDWHELHTSDNDNTNYTWMDTGVKTYWKSDSEYFSTSTTNYYSFYTGGTTRKFRYNFGGNISSLINFKEDISDSSDYLFYRIFERLETGDASNMRFPSTTSKYCYSYMFMSNSYLEKAPNLPMTSLSEGCYDHMFSGCLKLTKAPHLPATSLFTNCYQYMFSSCSSLNFISLDYEGKLESNYFYNWVSNVKQIGTFVYNGPTRTYGASAIPSKNQEGYKWTSAIMIRNDLYNAFTLNCDENGSDSNLTNIQNAWNDAAANYVNLTADEKTKLAEFEDEKSNTVMSCYDYIFTKYGEEYSLSNFLEHSVQTNSLERINHSIFNSNKKEAIVPLVSVSAIVITALCAFAFYRKRKIDN